LRTVASTAAESRWYLTHTHTHTHTHRERERERARERERESMCEVSESNGCKTSGEMARLTAWSRYFAEAVPLPSAPAAARA
jgi:hypothetical protein